MLEFFNYLNSIHPLSPEATAALMKVIKVKELRKGQVWLQEGAVCDKFCFLVKGLVKIYFEIRNKELIVNLANENKIILATHSYFDRVPSRFTIRSVEPSVVLYITATEMNYLLDRFIELHFHLFYIIRSEMAVLEWHTMLLLLPPKERWRILQSSDSLGIDSLRVSDRLLAAYLGVGANAICSWRKGD